MSDLLEAAPHEAALADLERDLIGDDGPHISTMRNYRFAIVPYAPHQEFEMRAHVTRLSGRLREKGWQVLSISLHALMLDLVGRMDPQYRDSVIRREKRNFAKDPLRALDGLKEELVAVLDETRGLAAAVTERIARFTEEEAVDPDRTVVFIGRAGAMYPFFRSSALLKHLDGRVEGLPVVLLYPGERQPNGLSFMGILPPDSDYRPRIYG